MYDHDDFLCVASSKQQFKLEPDDVRKVCYSHDFAHLSVVPLPNKATIFIAIS
jgi:hypothetical protein